MKSLLCICLFFIVLAGCSNTMSSTARDMQILTMYKTPGYETVLEFTPLSAPDHICIAVEARGIACFEKTLYEKSYKGYRSGN